MHDNLNNNIFLKWIGSDQAGCPKHMHTRFTYLIITSARSDCQSVLLVMYRVYFGFDSKIAGIWHLHRHKMPRLSPLNVFYFGKCLAAFTRVRSHMLAAILLRKGRDIPLWVKGRQIGNLHVIMGKN